MSQRPSLAMPMGTRSKRLRSTAAITDAAPARETSCSPDRPPNTTPTRSFPGVFAMRSVVSDHGFPGRELLEPDLSRALLLVPPRPPFGEAVGHVLLGAAIGRLVVHAAPPDGGQVRPAHPGGGGGGRALVAAPRSPGAP